MYRTCSYDSSKSFFLADFSSTELDSLPFTFTSGVITHESHVDFAESHDGILSDGDFDYTSSRKRRSVNEQQERQEQHVRVKRATTTLGVSADFGNIVNPAVGGVSGSPMELLVGSGNIFILGDISGHGEFVLMS